MTGEMSVKHELRLFPVRLLPARTLSLSLPLYPSLSPFFHLLLLPAKTMANESVCCVLRQLCELTSMGSRKKKHSKALSGINSRRQIKWEQFGFSL